MNQSSEAQAMSNYMGKMHIVKGSCGHVFAACWVEDNEKDAKAFKRSHQRKGRKVETIDRYEGEPMPEWCSRECAGSKGDE